MNRYSHFGDDLFPDRKGPWVMYSEASLRINAEVQRGLALRERLERAEKDRDDNHRAYCEAKEEAALYKGAVEEWKEEESIRNSDLTQQLAVELQRNTALRAEMEKEVQRTADAYRAQRDLEERFRKAEHWNNLCELELQNARSITADAEQLIIATHEHLLPLLRLYGEKDDHPVIEAVKQYVSALQKEAK